MIATESAGAGDGVADAEVVGAVLAATAGAIVGFGVAIAPSIAL